MKIMHITKKYPPLIGGDANIINLLEKVHRFQGHDVLILTLNNKNIKESTSTRLLGPELSSQQIDKICLKRILGLFSIKKQIKKEIAVFNPDILHAHSLDLAGIALKASNGKVPVIVTVHGLSLTSDISKFKAMMEKRLLTKYAFNKIVSVDQNAARAIKNLNLSNVVHIPNGIEIAGSEKADEAKSDKFRFLFVGRLEEEKGLEYLINAYAMLPKELAKKTELKIIGAGSLRGGLEKMTMDLQADGIDFAGPVQKKMMGAEYQKARALVLSSITEGMPLTILEAWLAGLPVIATEVGGIPTICETNIDSLLVPARSPKNLAEAMQQLATNQKLCAHLGENGKNKVLSEYSSEKMAENYLKLYREVIAS